ncbi:ATP-binding protein, partial [Flavihumibacter solisilvae]
IEVKFRSVKETQWEDHLLQAKNFSKFLLKVHNLGNDWLLWKTAFCSIVGRMVEYGLNLAASRCKNKDRVYNLGFELIDEIFSNSYQSIEFDESGRLIYVCADELEKNDRFDMQMESTMFVNYARAQAILFDDDGVSELIDANPLLKEFSWNLHAKCEKAGSSIESLQNDVLPPKSDGSSDHREIQEISPENVIDNFHDSISAGTDSDTTIYLREHPFGLKFEVGSVVDRYGERKYFFNPGSTEVNQLNIGVIGDLGTGKTQLLKSLIYNMSMSSGQNRGTAPKFLVLDTKRDYDGTGSELDNVLIQKIGAEVVVPYKIKLNMFDIKSSREINPALSKANFFIDLLGKIYGGIGPIQRNYLRDAVLQAFKKKGYVKAGQYKDFISPTLIEVRDEYHSLVNTVDSALAIMNSLIEEEFFEDDSENTVSFDEMFTKTIIVALGKIASSSQSLKFMMVVFLKLYQEYMLGIEKFPYIGESPSLRKIDSFILIDEAKLIMDYNFPVLEDLLRKGREFGVGVILSTQYLSDFTSGKIDYKEPLSTWFIHKVPNISAKEIKSIGIPGANDDLSATIQTLEKHFCLYKTVGVNGTIIRGRPFYKLI